MRNTKLYLYRIDYNKNKMKCILKNNTSYELTIKIQFFLRCFFKYLAKYKKYQKTLKNWQTIYLSNIEKFE